MQVNIQKIIFLLLLGLLSTGLFSHDSYAGDPCVNDTDCKDSKGTVHACIFGECMYAYKSYQDVTCTSDTDCTLLNNPCNHFTCSDQGYCITQSPSSLSPGDTCKQNECGKATCDDYRKFCGIGFDASTSQIEYLVTTSLGAACNDGDNNSCTVGACSKKDPTDPTKDIASKTNMICNSTAKDCSDASLCTVDSCDPSTGICAHPQKNCSAQGDQCNNGDCNPDTGQCIKQPKSGNPPCSDDNQCTVGDVCSNGTCTSGPPKVCNDANPCTDDSCIPSIGCWKTPDTDNNCLDGNVCDGQEQCNSFGTCVEGTPLKCDDGVACTDDACGAISGCKNTPNNTKCNDNVACTIDTCSATNDCSHVPDNSSCDDNNPCTIDSCDAATGCKHEVVTCGPKANECISGDYATYQPGVCKADATAATGYVCDYSPTIEDCDDKIGCTSDSCSASGGCYHGPHDSLCDDKNGCTTDSCSTTAGCQNIPNTKSCDDGQFCTQNDKCSDGACTGGGPKVCNDGVSCTVDGCDEQVNTCTFTSSDNLCTNADGLECTVPTCDKTIPGANSQTGCAEVLLGGYCIIDNACWKHLDINPNNPCQQCNTSIIGGKDKWSNVADNTSCTDGNECTTPDLCKAGQCAPGAALDCNDDNACTNDECSPSAGCSHPFNDNACSDGNACTSPDVCTSGICASGPPKDCNDTNPCTTDNCDSATGDCTNEANATFTCTDPANPWCDVGVETEPVCQYLQSTCHVISCVDVIIAASNDPMPNYAIVYSNDPDYFNTLTPAELAALQDKICSGTGIANVDLGTTYVPKINCVVSQQSGQQFPNNKTAVQNDLKQEANPPVGDPLHYFMTFPYPEGVKTKTGPGDVTCTVELTDIQQTSVACTDTFTVNACATDANCDDGDPCTTDSCNTNGACSHADVICDPTQPSECVNGSYKTYFGGTCTPSDSDPTQYECLYNDQLANCDDGNACTDDLCTAAGCYSQPNSNVCDDGDACTTGDVCKNGSCSAGAATDCNDSNVCTTEQCDTATGKCTSVPSGDAGCCTSNLDCEDSNVCTEDTCNTATGACSHANVTDNIIACDDGSLCTVDDKCVAGDCKPGAEKLACNDNASNPCKIDSCAPTQGCVAEDVANGTSCADTNLCNGDEVCENGSCVAGMNVNCDDDNRCTQDLCTSDGSCSHSLVDECSGPPEWCYVEDNIPVDLECTYKEPVCQVIVCGDGTVKSTAIGESLPTYFVLYSNDPKDFDAAKLAQLKDNLCTKKLAENVPLVGAFGPQISCTIKQGATSTDANIPPIADGDLKKIPSAEENIPYPRFISKPLNEEVTKILGPGSIECIVSLDFDPTTTKITEACVAPFEVKDCAVDTDCNDDNACTNDICTEGACTHTDYICEDKAPKCLDSDGTVFHITYAPGGCSPTNDPNSPECIYTETQTDCDDKNPCTTDACDPSGGCTHVNNAEACDDGNSCTVDDVCEEGKCEPGVAKTCNDSSVCTDDSCNPTDGQCVFASNSNPNCCNSNSDCDDKNSCTSESCDMTAKACIYQNVADNTPCADSNLCNGAEACKDGDCTLAPTGLDCDDDNICTLDGCEQLTGCTHTPNNVACDDKNACTVDDACTAGACAAGPAASCDDGNACTEDSCDPSAGCTHESITTCCNADADCGAPKDACTNLACTDHECVETTKPNCCITEHTCPDVGPCQNKTCVNNVCGAEPIDNCCESDADCADDEDKCTDEICDPETNLCSSTPNDKCNACPDGTEPKTCYLVDHHLTANPGDPCLTCQDDAGNVILSWKNGGNICPPVLDVSQAPNGDVVVTFVPDHIFKFNTGVGAMQKFFFEPPLGLLQDIDLFEITAADGKTSNHAYVTTVAGGLYKGDLTSGAITSVVTPEKGSADLAALAPYFLATNADGKQIFLGHTLGIKQLTLDENYQFVALGEKFTKEKGDGGDPHGFELYNGLLFYGLMSYTQIFDSSNFANNFKVYEVYYSIKLSHDKMFTVDIAPEGQPGHDYGQFSFAPINAADPKPWADVIKVALGIVGEDLQIPVQPVPNIAKMESGVALGQLTDVCGGTWDLKIPLDEICDNIDNDLDGKVDEDENGDPLSKPMDPIMGGLCEDNKMLCHHGEWVPWGKNYAPVHEVCNDGLDNDCDGMVDEDCEGCTIGDTHPCGIKIGECEPGHTECIANEAGVGVWTGVCEGGTGPVDEICGDNLDNDCDERIDENCCESKCCTTCCCCGTTYAPPAAPLPIPTPPEKEAEVEIEKEPEAVAEEAREEVPAASEEECVRKGNEWLYFDESGDLITEKRVDQMISLGLANAKCVAPAKFDGGGILDGCSLNPSAIRIAFNPVWLGLLSLFLLRLRKRDR